MGLFRKKKLPELPLDDDLADLDGVSNIAPQTEEVEDEEILKLKDQIAELEKYIQKEKTKPQKVEEKPIEEKVEEIPQENQDELTEERMRQIIDGIATDIYSLDSRLKNVEAFCFKHRSI